MLKSDFFRGLDCIECKQWQLVYTCWNALANSWLILIAMGIHWEVLH